MGGEAVTGEICGDELNFLTYKMPIRSWKKGLLLRSKRFYNRFLEIKGNGIYIDTDLIYQELEAMLFPMLHEESRYLDRAGFKAFYLETHSEDDYQVFLSDRKAFLYAVGELSESVYNDSKKWEFDYEKEYGEPYISPAIECNTKVPEESEDLLYIVEICDGLKPSSIGKLLTEELTVKAFREAGKITDIRHAYEVFAPVFFRCVRHGYKHRREKQRIYYRLHGVAEDFGDVLFADKQHWHEDYAAWQMSQKGNRKAT